VLASLPPPVPPAPGSENLPSFSFLPLPSFFLSPPPSPHPKQRVGGDARVVAPTLVRVAISPFTRARVATVPLKIHTAGIAGERKNPPSALRPPACPGASRRERAERHRDARATPTPARFPVHGFTRVRPIIPNSFSARRASLPALVCCLTASLNRAGLLNQG